MSVLRGPLDAADDRLTSLIGDQQGPKWRPRSRILREYAQPIERRDRIRPKAERRA